MKSFHWTSALIFFLVVLSGCIRDVALTETNWELQPVLNGILDAAKDTLIVHFSWSKPIQAAQSFEPEKNARIQLFEYGKFAGEFNWKDSSAYYLPFQVIPGKTYKIEASAGGKTVWAETTVPQPVNATIEQENPKVYGNNYLAALTDSPDANNFYWISATGYEGVDENRKKNIACLIYSNFEFADDFNRYTSENGVFKFEYDYYLRFPDNQLPGKQIEILFRPQCISMPMEVFLLSTDYHLDKYMKSSLLTERMEIYAEDMPIIYAPLPIYSNIHGGTGIFGSFTGVSKEFSRE
jgi:hypothetical protein